MEKDDGSWKSIEKGEISEKDVRDLAAGFGVEGETIEEIVEGLHKLDEQTPITEFEIQQALDPNIVKAAGKKESVLLKESEFPIPETAIIGRSFLSLGARTSSLSL